MRSLRSIPPVSCMQGYQQPPQATPVHPNIQALHHAVLPPPQQPNVFSRPEVITSRRIGPTAVIVSKITIFSCLLKYELIPTFLILLI